MWPPGLNFILLYLPTRCALPSVHVLCHVILLCCVQLCRFVYLQDLTAIRFDVLQLEALSLLWVTVLLQVTLFGFDLEGEQTRVNEDGAGA